MFDKTKFLVVGDALVGVDRANNRLNAAKAQLETAKGVVETARADIETAKEGVAVAKANLDTILAGFDNSGLSKAAILSTAEELNRVFSAVEPVSDQEAVAEPELSKSSARKVIESLRDLLSTVSDRADYVDLRSPIEEILAAATSVGGSVKDDSEVKPKRKRRSKGEDEETAGTEATTTAPVETGETAVSETTVEAEVVVAEAATAEEALTTQEVDAAVEQDAEVVVEADAVTLHAVVEEAVVDVQVDAVEEAVQEVVEAPAEEVAEVVVNEVNNDEVKDEVIELIDSNVSDPEINNLLATTAFAVYLSSQDRPLSLADFLDDMSIETLTAVHGSDFLDEEMNGLVANLLDDAAYVSSALTWFVAGVRGLEEGKDFPAFEGVSQGEAIEEVSTEKAVVEIAEEVAPVAVVEAVEIDAPDAAEEADLTVADDQTIVGHVDDVAEVEAAAEEPLVLDEAEEDAAPVVAETTPAVEAAPAAQPVEKPASAPARPAPSAPAEGLKKPNFFQRPSFPTKG